jgi:hypothetical protein
MEVVARCIKCGRPLRDPESIARGMGPKCAGDIGRRRRKYRSGVRSRSSSSYTAMDHGGASAPTLLSLAEDFEQQVEQVVVEEVSPRKNGLAKILTKYPTGLIDLVLSTPASGAVAWHVKKYSKKRKKLEGWMPPGKILQEIRRMCIDLRLTFWPGMSNRQGQQIACVPYGDEGWKFENSEKVMSRQELESYLARYGMIRSASK